MTKRFAIMLALVGCGTDIELAETSDALDGWTTIDDHTTTFGFHDFDIAVTSNGTILLAAERRDDNVFATTWVIRRSTNDGATWTGTTYVYPSGSQGHAYAIAADPTVANTVYAAGRVRDKNGNDHWLVRRSVDNGANWSNVDDWAPTNRSPEPLSIAFDAAGTILVAGQVTHATGAVTWKVRRSTDHGVTWLDSDSVSGSAGVAWANGVCTYANDIYVSGYTAEGNPAQTWRVRKSTDHGASWVEVFALPGTYIAGDRCSATSQGVVAAGQMQDASGNSHWLLRYMKPGGTTFQPIDDVAGTPSAVAFAPLLVEGTATAYVAGFLADYHVRKTTNITLTPVTVDSDDFTDGGGAGPAGGAHAITSHNGHFYSTGWSLDASGIAHGIVRKL
jgi:hypothetical protein